ncbi:hypothetical protein J7546_25820, partial [Escherichia coli]|uniref:hypothetical protein n=1 Tax=Escherichia coli TaxID=562 RepID=UPI001AE8C46E
LHGDVLMWLMKTLLTSGCTNQRGAGQGINQFSDRQLACFDTIYKIHRDISSAITLLTRQLVCCFIIYITKHAIVAKRHK